MHKRLVFFSVCSGGFILSTVSLTDKKEALLSILRSYGSLAVAFSGGVDSTFLLKMAHDVLGDQLLAVTASSPSFPKRELQEALDFCAREGIRHISFESDELKIEGFSQNPENRCYLCKTELFRGILNLAASQGITHVAEGSNLDDEGDYRPGLQAIRELHILSPLREAGLTKQDIRDLSREMGLPTWDKPSFACLASRFVYGETISKEKLEMIDRAEQLLLDQGFRQVRVRMHGGTLARIEVEAPELERLLSLRSVIVPALKAIGFTYVTMDLTGYRTGSMNETIL